MNSGLQTSLKRLANLLPENEFTLDPDIRKAHSGDKWFATSLPDAVALPKSTESVSRILKFAQKHGLPVTPRGSGFGYVGGCVPVKGGIVISLAGMNRIKEIHARDFVAIVEPGVITGQLQEAAGRKGLFYPPDPARKGDSSIGGNIATNAGGPCCLKYGVTRDYVLGLEVVLPTGEAVRLGSRTHKNKTGFDLARMFVGSEGMLGLITEATIKLLPRPPFRACIGAGFRTTRSAARAIEGIFKSGMLPSAVEVADAFTLQAVRKRTGTKMLDGCRAHLIVEIDGQEYSVRNELKKLIGVITEHSPVFIQKAFGLEKCELIWQLRREYSYSLRDTGLTKLNEDVVVPRGRLEDLFRFAERLQKNYGIPIACFGHAGDGNIHVNVMIDPGKPEQVRMSRKILNELFKQILDWGGVITGEHGIGLAKKPGWKEAADSKVRDLHLKVKKALDPKGILNPGKFL